MIRFLTIALCFSTNALAGIGSITEQFNAPPAIQRAKSNLTGIKGTGVEMLDAIRTTQGKAGITFTDDTKVQISENSKLVVDDYVYDPKNNQGG